MQWNESKTVGKNTLENSFARTESKNPQKSTFRKDESIDNESFLPSVGNFVGADTACGKCSS